MDPQLIPSPEDNPGSLELHFLSASSLAACGRLDEARDMLCPNGVPPSTPQALDLLARIAVQTGDLAQARKLWESALKKNSSFEPAQKALASLGSPWFAIAVTKRIALLMFATTVGCLAFVGLLSLFHALPSSTTGGLTISASRQPAVIKQDIASAEAKPVNPVPSFAVDASKENFTRSNERQDQEARRLNEQIQELQVNQTNMLTGQKRAEETIADLRASLLAQSAQQKETHQLIVQERSEIHILTDAVTKTQSSAASPIATTHILPQLNLAVDGISSKSQAFGSAIYFNDALFDRDDHFKIGSKSLLESVALALVQTQEKINIEVVGFAVNEPPTWPWQNPKSDADLGQLRAEQVKRVIENLKFFPSGCVIATNGPSTDRPYPAEARRNRTVVLKVYQSQAK
jgi:hypothetical protein